MESWESKMPEVVSELKRSMSVDDMLGGAHSVEQAKDKKSKSIEIFDDAKFVFHKWSSNVAELKDVEIDKSDGEGILAKQQLRPNPLNLRSWVYLGIRTAICCP